MVASNLSRLGDGVLCPESSLFIHWAANGHKVLQYILVSLSSLVSNFSNWSRRTNQGACRLNLLRGLLVWWAQHPIFVEVPESAPEVCRVVRAPLWWTSKGSSDAWTDDLRVADDPLNFVDRGILNCHWIGARLVGFVIGWIWSAEEVYEKGEIRPAGYEDVVSSLRWTLWGGNRLCRP